MPVSSSSAESPRGKLVVVGQGYVGLPLAMRAVDAGYHVIGVELDERRAKQLESSVSYVRDISSERLAAAQDGGHYQPCADYSAVSDFEACIIAVPTPLTDRIPDMSYIADAGRSIAPYVTPGSTVVLESTTYPGTTEELLAPLLEAGSGLKAGRDFFLGYSPERIDPGNQRWRLENTPKVVAGIDDHSLARVRDIYGKMIDRTVPVSSIRTAELTKLIENTYRHVNVALINEMAMFAAELGTDIWEAVDAAATKPFGYQKFVPGPGAGGHCLPIDPSYLSWHVKQRLGRNFRFVDLANDINDHMPEYIVSRVGMGLNRRSKPVNGSHLLLLGLSYKRNVGDVRESPAIDAALGFGRLGASVFAVEPFADPISIPMGIPLVELTEEEVARADAVVILTDHDLFDYEWLQRTASYVFDTRHRCHGDHVERL